MQNDHYLRDTATFNLAFGAALAVAVKRRQTWRTPVLCCVALQFALHAINHLADIGAAQPALARDRPTSLARARWPCCYLLARESTRTPEVQR